MFTRTARVVRIIRVLIRKRRNRLREWCLRFPNKPPFPDDGRNAQVLKLMNRLNRTKQVSSKTLRTGADIAFAKKTNLLRSASAGFVLAIFAASVVLLMNIVDVIWPRFVARIADLFLVISVLFWIALDMVPPFLCLAFFRESAFRMRQIELAHDLRMVEDLRTFDVATLKAGEQWLDMKLERIRWRMMLTFGGSDKLALFALVGLAWALWNHLQTDSGFFSTKPVTYGLSALLGMTMGGILNNVVTKDMLYQKDIVTMAIRKREEEQKNT